MSLSDKEKGEEREDFALALTLPAFFSITLYALSFIFYRMNLGRGMDIFEVSFLCGLVAVITSPLCLLIYRFRSREIIKCQILNILWLGCIAYSFVFLGPIGMQN